MSDATGHRDKPNVGPLNSAQIAMGGVPTNYYWYRNEAGQYEVVKANPPGTLDTTEATFASWSDLMTWCQTQWSSGSMG